MSIKVALFSHSPYLQGGEKSLLETALVFKDDLEVDMIPILPRMPVKEGLEFAQLKKLYTIEGPESSPVRNWYIYKSPKREEQFDEYCQYIKEDLNEYIKILTENKFDLLVVNTLTNFIPYLAANIVGIPVISWIRGYLDPKEIAEIDPEYQMFIDSSILKISDHTIYCSDQAKEKYLSLMPDYNYKDSVILNYTSNPNNFREYETTNNLFVCLNRLEVAKGVECIVDAANLVNLKGYNFNIEIYGEGLEKENLINKMNSYNLQEKINILSRNIDVDSIYNKCCAVLQPSHYESFGRTLIEALAHKRPIIAANTADPVGIIQDGINGFHINKDDYVALAKYMIQILEDKEYAKNMGEAGYKIFTEKYDGRDAKEKLKVVIKECIKNYKKEIEEKQDVFDKFNKMHNNLLDEFY